MLAEAASFGAAALVHSGVLIAGYEHEKARIAEVALVTGSSRGIGPRSPGCSRAKAPTSQLTG